LKVLAAIGDEAIAAGVVDHREMVAERTGLGVELLPAGSGRPGPHVGVVGSGATAAGEDEAVAAGVVGDAPELAERRAVGVEQAPGGAVPAPELKGVVGGLGALGAAVDEEGEL
jgi:hypothetical protein